MESSPDKYRRQLAEAWAELRTLESMYRNLGERIQDLRDLIRANANFLPASERGMELMLLDTLKHPTNIAEAVRVALFIAKLNKEHLTAVQIKERIESRGFSLSEYTNPLASIHTILRRMKESDPAEVSFNEKTNSYLLTDVKMHDAVAPEFIEKLKGQAWERIVGTALSEPLNPEKAKALISQFTERFWEDEYFRVTRDRQK